MNSIKNYFNLYRKFILKIDKYIPQFIIAIFLIPWSFIGFENYEIKIKELFIFFLFFSLFIQYLNGKSILIDNAGRVYLYFIIVCIFFTFIEFFRLNNIEEILFVLHIFVFTLINFLIYFLIFNLNLKNNYQKFINFLFLILCLFIYFVYYSLIFNI